MLPGSVTPQARPSTDFVSLGIASGTQLCQEPHSYPGGPAGSRDLELMHHYCTCTADTMAVREDLKAVWRVVIPREGYSNPFVMHGILAIAAIHKAYLLSQGPPCPADAEQPLSSCRPEREVLITISAYHQTLGLEGFKPKLIEVTDENWKAVFVFASLVIAYVCLLPARTQEPVARPVAAMAEMFRFVRGLQSCLEPWLGKIRLTDLAPMVDSVWIVPLEDVLDVDPPISEDSPLPRDTFPALRRLTAFFEAELPPGGARQDYAKAARELTCAAVLMAHAGPSFECGTVMFVPYLLPERVMADVESGSPHGLVFLAHFCLLFDVGGVSFWFVRGWGRQVLAEIDVRLTRGAEERFREMVSWPREHVMVDPCAG